MNRSWNFISSIDGSDYDDDDEYVEEVTETITSTVATTIAIPLLTFHPTRSEKCLYFNSYC